ncbi:hypothetical protein [Oerskovia merdavium]|uniref:Uncharacterized protein n=1 Tax=Oerskovia merdavium TaxID=2762227 RepID=A0ABR8U4T0_9CELL|nr:hypothetical protein [Oerskovia merdavium]MBD7982755.1 hypothetical protein [Oerskovia merdavium]
MSTKPDWKNLVGASGVEVHPSVNPEPEAPATPAKPARKPSTRKPAAAAPRKPATRTPAAKKEGAPEVVRVTRAAGPVKDQLNTRVPLDLKNTIATQVNEAKMRGESRTVEQVVTEGLVAWVYLPEELKLAVKADVSEARAKGVERGLNDVLADALAAYFDTAK